MSINDSLEKINPVRNREGSQRPSISNGVKQFIESNTGKDILTVIIVILVGLGSFGLGRLSKDAQNEGIWVEYAGEEANIINSLNNAQNGQKETTDTLLRQGFGGQAFFASSKGTKYYSVSCSAGKTIKQENRVYFNTREEAEAAGYQLSSSCI